MPAPTTLTDADRARDHAAAVDALIFLVVVSEEEDIDQGTIDRRAEEAGHSFGLLLAGFVERKSRRAEHDFECRERSGIMPTGLLLDVSRGGGTEKTEFGLALDDRAGPALAVFEIVARLGLGANHAAGGIQ